MKDNATKILFSLSETDNNIQELTGHKIAIETHRRRLSEEFELASQSCASLEARLSDAQARQNLEESRLKEEETRIVERRKQLTALGGMKSAKLIEREIDIANRALEAFEKNVLEATEVVVQIKAEVDAVKSRLVELEKEMEIDKTENTKVLAQLVKKLAELDKERNVFLGKLEDRLKNLYVRVNNRYKGKAVALVKNASCRSCFRALPAQLYNQVMAGNRLLQCPGCSRILVYSGE